MHGLGGLTWGDWRTDGITLQGKTQWYTTAVEHVGGWKRFNLGGGWSLVALKGACKNVTAEGQVLVNIPAEIRPKFDHVYTNPCTGKGHARIVIESNGNIAVTTTSTGLGDASFWYPFETTYVIKS